MKEITPIHKFKEGMTIQGFYLCVDKHVRHTRTGDLFIDLVLRDKTGQIYGKVWNKVKSFNEKFTSGEAVVAKADVSSYQGRLQLDIKKILMYTHFNIKLRVFNNLPIMCYIA